jgi:ATP-binding cassette subfamily G (WHITE) protein 2 (SNQ2)
METEYNYPTTDLAKQQTEDFKEGVIHERHKSLPKSSPLTVSFANQVKACISRQYQVRLPELLIIAHID